MVSKLGVAMRYYGQISPRRVLVALALALATSAFLHIDATMDFIERTGTSLSQMRSAQTSAQTAAFRLLMGDNEKHAEFDAR